MTRIRPPIACEVPARVQPALSCHGRGCTCCSSDVSRPSHVLPLLEDTAWHLPRALRPPGMQGRGARVIAWLGHLAQSSENASCPDGPSRTWLTATCVLHQSTTKSDGRCQIPRPRNPRRAYGICRGPIPSLNRSVRRPAPPLVDVALRCRTHGNTPSHASSEVCAMRQPPTRKYP